MLDSLDKKEKEHNRASLKRIIDTTIFCGENEIPLQGHWATDGRKPFTKGGQFSSVARVQVKLTKLNKNYSLMRSRRFRPSTTNTTSGAHGGIVQSRTEVDLILTDFDKDKREAIVSLPRKMLVKYTVGNDCQHQKSSTIFNNTKYTEENSV
ncbi:hypothetical protein J6590_020688 [Homalodisca vitripennis]|nr:hypothetical protein J6590_020688 [Homalodisca vitripennis]